MSNLLNESRWTGKGLASEWRSLAGGVIDVIEPATGQLLARVARANAADVRASAAQAKAAQKAWFAMPYGERAKVFRKAAELIEQYRAEVATWVVRETGGIPPKAMFEIDSVIHHCYESAAMLTQPKGLLLPSVDGVTSIARRVPHGVVGVISPFNFPFLLTSRATLPALACGNAVVLKPDARTPVSGGVLLGLFLEAAGLPVPTSVNGITQKPIDGKSLLPSLSQCHPKAPRTQYFEIGGKAALYQDGWFASMDLAVSAISSASTVGVLR